MTWKDTCRECRWNFRFWNYYFVLLTSKWHKGWAGVVVFNHFWVTHIFENLMKAMHSLPSENQICAHMQNFACKYKRFTWWITHPWVSQGSTNPSLSISDLSNKHLHALLICRAFSNLSLVIQLSKVRTHFTLVQKKYCQPGLLEIYFDFLLSNNFHPLLLGNCTFEIQILLVFFKTHLLTLIPFLPPIKMKRSWTRFQRPELESRHCLL